MTEISKHLPVFTDDDYERIDLDRLHLEEMKEVFIELLEVLEIGVARERFGYYPHRVRLVKKYDRF